MIIRDMFQDDINRQINGVIKVDQSAEDVVRQEVKEYIITKELKKHIITFFNFYDDSFITPTADIGVWISGFFGSGKSHFLKMLSYILSNKKIGSISTVEAFRSKFEDDPATFMMIDNATRNLTETILFNIDVEGPLNKDKTAVIRVFAKMFYNHLGFYGEDLKVAKLEQFIEKQGKTARFRESFKNHNGGEWLESRASYNFFEDDVVSALQEVLCMSESAARNWFDGTETAEISIAQLVSEIKEYVDTKPKNFRLLFMIDEVGQYIGEDTNLLLNLQSLVEELGSVCMGQVWVVCTGQEAVDEIIRVRQDEFSRIQARFKTRLSLTSSSVDEVVQKRILKKKAEAVPVLEEVYGKNDSVLKNLFTFTDCVLDIKGYSGPTDFVINYPFVPYQFIVMQKVFNEIRKHGNAGRHQSNGERSMLSGFQETAQRLQDRDENTLAPFYMFYDTLHSFLDGAIRRVIERCEKAAVNGDGIEEYDVSVLKLLYLIRYIDNDIKSTIDNITILMADNINVDKIALREKVCASLDRLLSQNYIGRSGDSYNFLTDEEQDIQKDIQREQVDTSALVKRIGDMIYGDIYTSKKYRYDKKYDFAFDGYVDGIAIGTPSNNMQIKFLTVATDPTDKTELRLRTQSSKQITVVLADTPYYSSLESAMKIRNYVKRRNVSQMPKSMQDIIRGKQDEATNYENEAMSALRKAMEEADFYVDGEKLQIRGGDAKSRIDQAFEYLVEHVYSELTLIEKNYEFDSEIREVLTGQGQQDMVPPNSSAAAKVEEFLEMQQVRHLPTSMADIQSRYQAIPYGWREIDIAAVVALLIRNQKVTIKYSGMTIQPDHPKLVDMLRKRTETGKTLISKRLVVAEQSMKRAKAFLREYFDKMDVPSDEDGLIKFINESFTAQLERYRAMYARFQGHNYPNKQLVEDAVELIKDILSYNKDNIALVNRILEKADALSDNKDDMVAVEQFFKTQVDVFDRAAKFESDLYNDVDYIATDAEATKALDKIRFIVRVNKSSEVIYRSIPELPSLMATVKASHDNMLELKRKELEEIVRQCLEEIHTKGSVNAQTKAESDRADEFYRNKQEQIAHCTSLAILDGYIKQIFDYKDSICEKIEALSCTQSHEEEHGAEQKPKKIYKTVYRQTVFPSKKIESQEELDEYLAKVHEQLSALMSGSDGIEIK